MLECCCLCRATGHLVPDDGGIMYCAACAALWLSDDASNVIV